MDLQSDLVTDTIVITSQQAELDITDPHIVKSIQQWLGDTVLLSHEVVAQNPIQLIILRNFKRILIISPDISLSNDIMRVFHMKKEVEERNLQGLQFNYTLTNTNGNGSGNLMNQDQKEYLKVPLSDKLFLISPPSSPPPEFDYSKCEDIPQISSNVHSVPRWNSSQNNKNNIKSDKPGTYTLLTSNVANIVIDKCEDTNDDANNTYSTVNLIKTAAPPRSIFDTDEELDTDEEQ